MAGPIGYSLEVMYTLSGTKVQTDEGYTVLGISTVSIFMPILAILKII